MIIRKWFSDIYQWHTDPTKSYRAGQAMITAKMETIGVLDHKLSKNVFQIILSFPFFIISQKFTSGIIQIEVDTLSPVSGSLCEPLRYLVDTILQPNKWLRNWIKRFGVVSISGLYLEYEHLNVILIVMWYIICNWHFSFRMWWIFYSQLFVW